MIIGIDASRANKKQRTGTEWYSYFVIEEMKKLVSPQPSPGLRLPSPVAAGEGDTRFILYSREPLEGDLAKLPPNFESRVLTWPPRFLWTQIRLSWEMLVNPPDVLFVPAHTLPILGRTKRIVTIHDVGFRVYPELYSWIDILYHRFSVWFASRFAYKIICISEFTKCELIKYYYTDPKKISVIPLGVNMPHPASRLPSPSAQADGGQVGHSLPSGRGRGETGDVANRFLLYVGRLEKKKNILGILKAFQIVREKHPNLKLVLAGALGHGFEEIQNYIVENHLKDAVAIKGYVAEEEKGRLYQEALAFVFPTFYEGFGLPVLEAQARGCPVITSKFGATAEVAGGAALLADPYKPDEIVQAILALRDESVRRGIIEKGLGNCKKYSWKRTATETLEELSQ